METVSSHRIKEVWTQKKTPVIYRDPKKPLMLRLPYRIDNRSLLSTCQRSEPKWNKEKHHWTLTKSAFNKIVTAVLKKFGSIYIIQPYRLQEKCAPACMNAEGFECQCSCMGINHGSGGPNSDWYVVSNAFACKWSDRELACRLLAFT